MNEYASVEASESMTAQYDYSSSRVVFVSTTLSTGVARHAILNVVQNAQDS